MFRSITCVRLLALILVAWCSSPTARAAYINFYLIPTDLDGNEITEVDSGDKFLLRVYVQDARPVPPPFKGVKSAYLDIVYESSEAMVAGDIIYSDDYPLMRAGSTFVAGIIDEAGAMTEKALGGGAVFLLSVPFMATSEGTIHFTGNPADDVDWHPVKANMMPMDIPPEFVDYGSAWINVNTPVPEPSTAALVSGCAAAMLWIRRRR